mmetsp:Transcript_4435/g.11883  ORF Transcript_4435/g.11883 Transcript_4435/m.11883 type:complete len:243 (+) Transcript_4435:450-1178(+)
MTQHLSDEALRVHARATSVTGALRRQGTLGLGPRARALLNAADSGIVLLESHVTSVPWLAGRYVRDAEDVVDLAKSFEEFLQVFLVGQRVDPHLAVILARLNDRPLWHRELVEVDGYEHPLVVAVLLPIVFLPIVPIVLSPVIVLPILILPILVITPTTSTSPVILLSPFHDEGQRFAGDLLTVEVGARPLGVVVARELQGGFARGRLVLCRSHLDLLDGLRPDVCSDEIEEVGLRPPLGKA